MNLHSLKYIALVSLTAITCACSVFSDPGKSDSNKGFSKEISEMVPQWIIDDLRKNNMAIYEGKRPPGIEGTYFISPLVMVKGYDHNDNNSDYAFADYSYRLYNQSARNQKILVEYEAHSTDGSDYGDGNGTYTYVSGHGNYFTIFAELNGVSHGIANKSIKIISGEITREGIKNLVLSLTLKSKGADYEEKLIPVGAHRIFEDGDGFSEKYSGTFRMGEGNEKSDTLFLPCILCNSQQALSNYHP